MSIANAVLIIAALLAVRWYLSGIRRKSDLQIFKEIKFSSEHTLMNEEDIEDFEIERGMEI